MRRVYLQDKNLSLKVLRKHIYRSIKYRLLRPIPPPLNQPFRLPVVVVGSAPGSTPPHGFPSQYHVVTVNASQIAAQRWGLAVPDMTFMQFSPIMNTDLHGQEFRQVLSGKQTKSLYALLWSDGEVALQKRLDSFGYSFDELYMVTRYERMALLDKVCGIKTTEVDVRRKCSNGINAVLFALYHGAPAVIISGINPSSAGHSYSSSDLPRLHAETDRQIIKMILSRGLPLFTSDARVSKENNIPIWTPR